MSVPCKNIFRSGGTSCLQWENVVFVCLCVCLQEAVIFYFHSVNLCGPVWEVKGDKGEEKEGKSQWHKKESEREKLKEREKSVRMERGREGGREGGWGGVEVKGKQWAPCDQTEVPSSPAWEPGSRAACSCIIGTNRKCRGLQKG